jgi:hypothetical protein
LVGIQHLGFSGWGLTVDSIDSIPLLESHGQASDHRPLEQTRVGDQGQVLVNPDHEVRLESPVLVFWILLSGADFLEFPQSLDFQEFNADTKVVGGDVAEPGQSLRALLLSARIHEMARRLRHEHQHARTKDQCREELQADWNQPCGIGLVDTCASDEVTPITLDCALEPIYKLETVYLSMSLTDPKRNHNPKSNGQLLDSDESSTDFRRRQFSVVQRYYHTQGSNTETSHEAAAEDVILVLRTSLDDDAHAKDDDGDDGRGSTTEPVGQVAVDERADPGAEFEDRRQKALVDAGSCREAVGLCNERVHG